MHSTFSNKCSSNRYCTLSQINIELYLSFKHWVVILSTRPLSYSLQDLFLPLEWNEFSSKYRMELKCLSTFPFTPLKILSFTSRKEEWSVVTKILTITKNSLSFILMPIGKVMQITMFDPFRFCLVFFWS